jgi:aryl-alcohol dehydrogenase-like predicted oxidoreductase
MIDRRNFFQIAASAGATLSLTPELFRALRLQQPTGTLIQRAIPSTGELLPVISFSPQQESDTAGMKEILKTVLDNRGKVVDVLHGGGEQVARTAADELGVQNKLFWTTVLGGPPPQPGAASSKADPAAVRALLEAKLAKFKVPMIDLVMVGTGGDVATRVAVMQEMKKEGKVRYIGIHMLATPPRWPTDDFARLESIMRNEPIDFVGTDYQVGWRGVEEKILPLALERKIGFMAYWPFDRRHFFTRVGSTPLPEWAAEFDAKTWAQFALKFVLGHPAVVLARTGTTKAAHMLDNLGGGVGRLPNEATRKRMAAFIDALPTPLR